MTLKYELKFFDYWHLGSGLSAGAKLDSTVVKDDENIPYASGKTIKGLIREMAEYLGDCTFVNSCFGGSSNDGKNGTKKDICYDKEAKNKQGKCYFSNAYIEENTKKEIVSKNLQDNLYDIIASTKIGEKNKPNETEGIAVDDSLREIEVVIPISLYGEISDIKNQDDCDKLLKSLKMIKRMGLNRNRGLGRCEFREIKCVS